MSPAAATKWKKLGTTARRLGGVLRRRWWAMLLLGLLAAGAVGTGCAYRYVHASATFCVSCHGKTSEQVHAGGHRTVACNQCHEAKFVQGVRQYLLSLYGSKGDKTEHGAVKVGGCKDCHLSNPVSRMQIGDTLGHQKHALGGPRVECVTCHGSSAHDPKPSEEACASCHKDIIVEEPGMAKIQCLCCHNFLARTSVGTSPVANDCQRCHGGKTAADRSDRFAETLPARPISDDMVHGTLTSCRLCHNPHQKDPDKRVKGKDCRRCHSAVGQEADSIANAKHADCEQCHGVHSRRSEAATGCKRCHEQPTQGPLTAASKHEQCTACHQPHKFRTDGSRCASCHEETATKLAALPNGTHADCLGCHTPHRQGPTANSCVGCHKPMSGSGHPSCLTCHKQHEGKEAAPGCPTCHGNESEQLRDSRTDHRAGCTACHAQHAVGGASAHCSRCHTAESALVSKVGNPAHERCGSCH